MQSIPRNVYTNIGTITQTGFIYPSHSINHKIHAHNADIHYEKPFMRTQVLITLM